MIVPSLSCCRYSCCCSCLQFLPVSQSKFLHETPGSSSHQVRIAHQRSNCSPPQSTDTLARLLPSYTTPPLAWLAPSPATPEQRCTYLQHFFYFLVLFSVTPVILRGITYVDSRLLLVYSTFIYNHFETSKRRKWFAILN